jgi:hypothetical protein
MLHCCSRGRVLSAVFAVSSIFFLLNIAQAQDEVPKADLFIGYQWLNPGGKVPVFTPPSGFVGVKPDSLPKGVGVAAAYNLSRIVALEGDFGSNWGDFGHELTVSAGPRLTWRQDKVNLFTHALVSYNQFGIKNGSDKNSAGGIFGGGIDLNVIRALSIRVIEADYVVGFPRYTDILPASSNLARPQLNGVRLRTGFVFNFGGAPEIPPTASCSVEPSEVMVGEPVTATVNTSNFNPKHTLAYDWSSNGGKVTGKDTTATIDTNGVAGGSYTVTAKVTDAKQKKNGQVSCNASFTVKEPPKNPPTMSCSANPSSVQAGTSVSLTCDCKSPDNVPVTVSGWTSTGGSVSGSGSNATLNTTGAPSGTITVNASCSDSRGLNTSASTQVTVENPPPPPPQASKLSECNFENMDKIKKPWRVDNECKAILDDVAKNLQQNLDNRVVIVGNAEPTEKRKNLAAERAVNSKAYLSGGESKLGIDPTRIETRTGNAGTKTAEFWVVPAGATFAGEGTQPVDESRVKAVPDHARAPAKKKAQ